MINPSKLTLLYHTAKNIYGVAVTVNHANIEYFSAFVSLVLHLLCHFRIDTNRLLAKHMLARTKGIYCVLIMVEVVGEDVYCLYLLVGKRNLIIGYRVLDEGILCLQRLRLLNYKVTGILYSYIAKLLKCGKMRASRYCTAADYRYCKNVFYNNLLKFSLTHS